MPHLHNFFRNLSVNQCLTFTTSVFKFTQWTTTFETLVLSTKSEWVTNSIAKYLLAFLLHFKAFPCYFWYTTATHRCNFRITRWAFICVTFPNYVLAVVYLESMLTHDLQMWPQFKWDFPHVLPQEAIGSWQLFLSPLLSSLRACFPQGHLVMTSGESGQVRALREGGWQNW